MRPETKATQIPPSVKLAVWLRDHESCIICGKPVPVACACAHVVRRSQGGKGVEQNVFTACPDCHNAHDTGDTGLREYVISYMCGLYPGWSREAVTYHKGG